MKKVFYLLLMIFGILLLPNISHAENLDIEFKNIQLLEKNDNTTEENNPTINGTTIDFDLMFKEVNDYITYKFEVVNNEDQDYELNLTSEDEYLTYELSTTKVAKKATTEINVTVKYNKAIPDEELNKKRTAKAEIKITDEDGNDVTEDITNNPKTSIGIGVAIIAIMIIAGTALIILKKNKAAFLVVALLAIPLTVLALKEIIFNINTTYEIIDVSGLRYKGYKLDEYTEDFDKLRYNIESMCMGETVNNNKETERDNYFDFSIHFEATSESSMDILLRYPNADTHLDIQTSLSIETDAETGDSRIVLGECTNNPELDASDFTYDGNPTTRDQVAEYIHTKICPSFRELMESLDTECVQRLIMESIPLD